MKQRLAVLFFRLTGRSFDRSGLVDTWRAVTRTVSRDRVFVYAGQAAMLLFISLFPFIMLLTALIQQFLPFSEEELRELLSSLAVGSDTLGLLNELAVELFDPPPVSVVSLSAVTALWSASRGVNAVRWGIRTMYRTPRKRHFLYHAATSLLYTVALFALLMLLLLVVVFGQVLLSLIRRYVAWLAAPLSLIFQFRALILPLLLTVFFMLLYRVLPARKLTFRAQLPGAVFAAVGWVVFSLGFSLYINNFSHYSTIYGSLAAVVLLLLWLYACMAILLLGAEINAYLLRRQQNRSVQQEESNDGTDPS